MTTEEAILGRRTVRKFTQKPIPSETLRRLVDAARLAPSGSNLQPLRYRIVNERREADALFPLVRWAAYIAPRGTPTEAERPVAYIIVCAETTVRKNGYETDAGAAVENMLLLAESLDIGSCWMGAIDRSSIRKLFGFGNQIAIHSLVALGYKAEHPVTEPFAGSVRYYKDETGTLHVPKRQLSDILL